MNVQCSWKIPDGKAISDAVIWSDGAEGADLEDEVMAENCVMLEAPNKGETGYPTVPACQLLFSSKPPFYISRITVLCEARVIEAYAHHGEYLKTIKNELLEEAEDMIVFRGDVLLDRPVNLCSIKFAGLRSASEMWLYGVKVCWIKLDSLESDVVPIPLAAVEHRLSQMGLALSDKAEAFKRLVEKCQNSPIFGQPDIGFFIATLQQCNLIKNKSPSPENIRNISESLDNLTKSMEHQDDQNNLEGTLRNNQQGSRKSYQEYPFLQNSTASVSTSPMLNEKCSSGSQTDEEYLTLDEKIKFHINEKLQEMDTKMQDRINQKFQELETKLLCKLDEIESFVKPHGLGSA